MYYGVARLEFLISQSRSLKEKRAVTRRMRDRLQSRYHLAVSEVDHQDLWQRSAFGFAVVALSPEGARNALQAARREAESDLRLEVIDFRWLVQRFDADRGEWNGLVSSSDDRVGPEGNQ